MSEVELDYWARIWSNVHDNFLEFTAVTSKAQGKYTSMAKGFGVGKSSLALWVSFILHYWEVYGVVPVAEMDTEDREIWSLVLERMTYDKLELIDWATRYERIPALIWDDAQMTAPSVGSIPEIDRFIASFLTTARTSIANVIMTMPELSSISKPFRQLVDYEMIVYDRGRYELQFIQTRKKFRNPYEDMKRMILLDTGEYDPPPEWVYKRYLEWRERERRRVIRRYLEQRRRMLERQGLEIDVPV